MSDLTLEAAQNWAKLCALIEAGWDPRRAWTEVSGQAYPEPPPIPLRLNCPICGTLHCDEGEQATKPHRTHACQACGHLWAPAVVPTVGVKFLPGCRNETTEG